MKLPSYFCAILVTWLDLGVVWCFVNRLLWWHEGELISGGNKWGDLRQGIFSKDLAKRIIFFKKACVACLMHCFIIFGVNRPQGHSFHHIRFSFLHAKKWGKNIFKAEFAPSFWAYEEVRQFKYNSKFSTDFFQILKCCDEVDDLNFTGACYLSF